MIGITTRGEQRMAVLEGVQTKQQLEEVWETAHKEVLEVQEKVSR